MSKRRPSSRSQRVNYTDMLAIPDDDSTENEREELPTRKKRRADEDEANARQKKRKRAEVNNGNARKREKERARDDKKMNKARKPGKNNKPSKPEPPSDVSSEEAFVVDKARRGKITSSTSSSTHLSAAMAQVSGELEELRSKSAALRQYRETESDRLLEDARKLAQEEKQTYEKLVKKLKKNVIELSKRVEEAEANQHSREGSIRTEHDLCNEKLEREQKGRQRDNDKLHKRIRDLEAQLAEQADGRDAQRKMAEAAEAADAQTQEHVELLQAKKLLGAYRLVTSIELRLIEGDDDEDTSTEHYTDLACAVVDSDTGKRFQFDLAIPDQDTEEIEFVPSDPPSTDFQVPSYLTEELSFKKAELTKFMRTLLDMTIKKKKEAGPQHI